jgi:hypothetical protein
VSDWTKGILHHITFNDFKHGGAGMGFINEAGWDRILRVLAGIVLIYLGLGGVIVGGLGVALVIIGFMLLITGLVGWCPLYTLLRIRTNKAS